MKRVQIRVRFPGNRLMVQLVVAFIAGMLFAQVEHFIGVTAIELTRVAKMLSVVALVCMGWFMISFYLSRFK